MFEPALNFLQPGSGQRHLEAETGMWIRVISNLILTEYIYQIYVSRTNIYTFWQQKRKEDQNSDRGFYISAWRFRWLILFPYCRRPLLSKYWQNIAYYLRYLEGVTYDDISVFDMCVLIEVIARAICKQRPSYSDQIAQHIIHLLAKENMYT